MNFLECGHEYCVAEAMIQREISCHTYSSSNVLLVVLNLYEARTLHTINYHRIGYKISSRYRHTNAHTQPDREAREICSTKILL